MKNKIKILCFTPYAGRTGSEILLFNFMKYIDKDKFDIHLFAMQKGELIDGFKDFTTVYYDDSYDNIAIRLIEKVRIKLGFKSRLEKKITKIHEDFKPDFWFLNTMILESVASIAIQKNIPFAVYFHEMLSQYNYISNDGLQKMCEHSLFTIGCSDPVCENLKIMGAKKILKQYGCIDTEKVNEGLSIQPGSIDYIEKIKADGKVVIGMSGQRIERKGFDVFIKVAGVLKDQKVHFLWLGESKKSGYEYFMNKYIEVNNINNISIIHPRKEEYYNYLNSIDLFFLSSNEDPFPLVMLEAVYLNKYIISFDSGGVNELLKEEQGCIIDNTGTEDVAKSIISIINKQQYILPERSNVFKYSIQTQSKNFETILYNVLQNNC